MFGFLKKKLQDAVAKFTKGAEESVKEEEILDEKAVEEAKREEARILEKRKPKVTEIKAAKREAAPKAAPEPEAAPARAALEKPAPRPSPKPSLKPSPKPSSEPVSGPAEQKPRPAPGPLPPAPLPKRKVKADEVAITYFVHGTTTDNEKGISSGHNDVALSTLGEQQARELTAKLKYDFDVIYASDLSRAVRSAELTWPGRGLIKDGRLREADYGDLAGKSERELEEYAGKHDLYSEGYPDGESLKDVERRMRSFLNDLYKVHRGKHVAIVGHKHPQLAIEVLLGGKTWAQAIAEDWRKRKAWQPGWEYALKKQIPDPAPEKGLGSRKLVEKEPVERRETRADGQKPKGGFLKSIFGKKKEEQAPPTPAQSPAPEAPAAAAEITPGIPAAEQAKEALELQGELEREAESRAERAVVEEVEAAEPEPEKRSIFTKLKETFTKKTLSEEKFEELFWDLEVTLLENNVALEVIEKIKDDMKTSLTAGKVSRLGVEDLVLLTLRQSVDEILSIRGFGLVERIKSSQKRPYIIAFIGVNGSGKTTTLAKIANLLQNEGLSVVMAASDTFRAAAIDQLKEHADRLGVKLISQGYGADPAAVAFDAVQHAKAKGIDVVMIDTAGRLHSNTNLMAELQKVVRVAQPDLKVFIGESITGNDCVEQAKEFDRLAGIDAIILSKADVDEKGGAALSVSYVTKKPILYLGVGQSYGDLKEFDKDEIVRALGL